MTTRRLPAALFRLIFLLVCVTPVYGSQSASGPGDQESQSATGPGDPVPATPLAPEGTSQNNPESPNPPGPGRVVAIHRSTGAPLAGDLVSADHDRIVLRSDGVTLTLLTTEVTAIDFQPSVASDVSQPVNDSVRRLTDDRAARAAADGVLRALHRLAAAARIGASYATYAPMVIESQTQLDVARSSLPPDFAHAATNAQYEFAQANAVLGADLKGPARNFRYPARGTVKNHRSGGLRQELLSAMWSRGRKDLAAADKLMPK